MPVFDYQCCRPRSLHASSRVIIAELEIQMHRLGSLPDICHILTTTSRICRQMYMWCIHSRLNLHLDETAAVALSGCNSPTCILPLSLPSASLAVLVELAGRSLESWTRGEWLSGCNTCLVSHGHQAVLSLAYTAAGVAILA